jgi:heme exporter protein D
MHIRAGLIWVWQVLAWPPSLFCVVYGSGAQLLIVPVSLVLNPTSPRTALLGSTGLSPLAWTTLLLLSARDATGRAGLAALRAGVQAASGVVVWGGIAYSLTNAFAVLLLAMVVEVRTRRAWLKKERQHQQQHHQQQHQQQQAAALCCGMEEAAAAAAAASAGPCCAGC